MKEEMMLQSVTLRPKKYECPRTSRLSVLKSLCLQSNLLTGLGRFYGRLLEMQVTPLQAFHLTHAQLAAFLMILPVECSPLVRALLVCWFALTVAQCRRSGLK